MRRRAICLRLLALAVPIGLLTACAAESVTVRAGETPSAPPGLTLLPSETPTATLTADPTDALPSPTSPAATATSVIALAPTPTGEAGAVPTLATAILAPTTPPAMLRPSPTLTALPPTATPSPTPTEGPCVNDAAFIEDVTVPDGAQFLPTQPFVKRWRVKNTGTCDWGPGYRLVLVSGDALTAPPGVRPQTEFALYPARAGTEAIWEIPMRAPDTPGTYTGRWEARDPQGNRFGALVFVMIEVIALPAQSP
ncbi:MAG: NBR1-Ig-like domain-containing protein [Anaerolineales bacterium]|nr:NBR1-Ig-like domain-containing protein [Anaerolineales bacterium]